MLRERERETCPPPYRLPFRFHHLVASASPNQDPPFSMILDVDVFSTKALATAFSKLTTICAIGEADVKYDVLLMLYS